MKKLRNILLTFIIVRAAIDVIGLLVPGVTDLARSMGWDVNIFWVKTVWPVTITFLVMGIIAVKMRVSVFFLVQLTIIPLIWSYVLSSEPGASTIMVIDSLSWFTVGICAFFVWKIDNGT